jgi:UDP-N-acetylglucosamine pyrophosphorylase
MQANQNSTQVDVIVLECRFSIITKPHGHGDVHFLLLKAGLIDKWLAQGKKWLIFFQDNNSLYLDTVLPALGVRSASFSNSPNAMNFSNYTHQGMSMT